MDVLIGPGVGQVAHLLQEQGILEDALNRLDQIRFQGAAVLLLGIAGRQELLQGVIAFVWTRVEEEKVVEKLKCKLRHLPNDSISMDARSSWCN